MVIKGILEQTTTAQVNLVNADLLSKERGLRISEKTVRSDGGEGAPPLTEMTVRLGTGATRFSASLSGGQISVSGTVKAGAPYLTKIGDFDVDLGIEGIFLLTRQIDQPGIIAGVAGVLCAGGVNISYMTVCRTGGKGGDAIMAVGLDDRPSEELIGKITSIGAISEFALVSED